MTAALIDGKALAATLRSRVTEIVRDLGVRHDLVPGLAVVLVGDNPASEVYVGAKKKMVAASGMRSIDHRLGGSTSRDALPLRLNSCRRSRVRRSSRSPSRSAPASAALPTARPSTTRT